MKKIILMQGLPASGKTRKAFEIYQNIRKEGGKVVRVSDTMLLNMLHFYHRGQGPTEIKEALKGMMDLTKKYLADGYTVIIDEMNLEPGVIETWNIVAKETGAELQIEFMNVPVQQCVFFDVWRDDSLGFDVINALAMKYELLPLPKKEFVICDIASLFTSTPDFGTDESKKAFRESGINEVYFNRLKELAALEYKIIFFSSIEVKHKGIIMDWLDKHGLWKGDAGFTSVTIFMGQSVKDVYETYFKTKYPIFRVLSGIPESKEWEKYGIYVEKL